MQHDSEQLKACIHKLRPDVSTIHITRIPTGKFNDSYYVDADSFDRDVPASLLHMDVWAQNILVDTDSRVTGLVDWDRALWGDPEIEFAVLDYCGISEPPFWQGYGQQRETSPAANLRRVFYLLYEVQKYIVIRQGRGKDSQGARRCKAQVADIVRKALDADILLT